jgi:hypothetical protein
MRILFVNLTSVRLQYRVLYKAGQLTAWSMVCMTMDCSQRGQGFGIKDIAGCDKHCKIVLVHQILLPVLKKYRVITTQETKNFPH